VSLAIAALALAVAPTSMLLVTFVVLGVGNGLLDVYLNVAAQREETRTRRPVLQWLHASYALGGVTGAGAAGALRTVGLDHRLGIAASASPSWRRRGGTFGGPHGSRPPKAPPPSCRCRRFGGAPRSGSRPSPCCSASSSRAPWTSGRASSFVRSCVHRRRPRARHSSRSRERSS
jgi:hypothetical protein